MRCNEVFSDHFITRLLLSPTVKEFENRSTYGKVKGKSKVSYFFWLTRSEAKIVADSGLEGKKSTKIYLRRGSAQDIPLGQLTALSDPSWWGGGSQPLPKNRTPLRPFWPRLTICLPLEKTHHGTDKEESLETAFAGENTVQCKTFDSANSVLICFRILAQNVLQCRPRVYMEGQS